MSNDSQLQQGETSQEILIQLAQRSRGFSGRDIKKISRKINERRRNMPLQEAIDLCFEEFRDDFVQQHLSHIGVSLHRTRSVSQDFSGTLGTSYAHAQQQIQRFLPKLTQNEHLHHFGLPPYNGILVNGPHGNGQDFLMHWLAGELRRDLVSLAASALSPQNFAETIGKIVQLSHLCGVVLFFEELAFFLQENVFPHFLDAIANLRSENVIFAAASTREVPEGFLGLFDMHLTVEKPLFEECRQIIEYFLTIDRRFTISSDIDWNRVVSIFQRTGASIDDIQSLCMEAKREAVVDTDFQEDTIVIRTKHFGDEGGESFGQMEFFA